MVRPGEHHRAESDSIGTPWRGLIHRFALIIASLVVVMATGVVVAVPASGIGPPEAAANADAAIDEAHLLLLINRTRDDRGLPTLSRDQGLSITARQWAMHMAAIGQLAHRGDLGAQLNLRVPGWRWGAENVGSGGTAQSMHSAFVASPGHLDNITQPVANRVGIGVIRDGSGILWVSVNFAAGPALPDSDRVAAPSGVDAWLASYDGRVRAAGGVAQLGDASPYIPWQPIVGMAPSRSSQGYWLVARDGGIFTFGDARFYGSMGNKALRAPIVSMSVTPSGRGYWLVGRDGSLYPFGDARNFGSAANLRLRAPVLGMAPTPTGKGYWLLARDGGIFNFGDAKFYGSTGNLPLEAPVVGIVPSRTGRGYWLVAADGGVFTYGDATFLGSAARRGLTSAVVGALAAPDGRGYWVFTSDARSMGFGSVASNLTPPLDPTGSVAFVVPR